MFRRQFRTKSKVQLKSSEQKKLLNDFKTLFPAFRDDDINQLSKEAISRARIITYNEEQVEVYFTDKTPILIDVIDNKLKLPTIHLLWSYPHLVPHISTNKFVIEKLKLGADLFLPGVHSNSILQPSFIFQESDIVGINIETNKAAFAVGIFTMSMADLMLNQSGKVVKVYHTVGDLLFKMHSMAVPELGPPDWLLESNEDKVEEITENVENLQTNDEEIKLENIDPDSENHKNFEDIKPEKSEKEVMDELLDYCFLKAVKSAPKNIYPILPANFYANHILPAVPNGEELNIKKTSWKKLSVYLMDQVKNGLLSVETMQKNELRILSVDLAHPKIREFSDPHQQIIVEAPKPGFQGAPTIQEVFSVTAATLPFFTTQGYKKSDQLTRQDIRNIVNNYIKQEQLQDPDAPDKVRLNPTLYQITKQELLSRAELISNLLSKMSVEHKISNVAEDGELHLHRSRGKMPLIEFNVCTRAGNKKVTLISNLECYGVDVAAFAKELQQKAAASAIVQPGVPGTKGSQVQVQGNQIRQAVQLLVERFHLAEKYMRGLEKAPKSKK